MRQFGLIGYPLGHSFSQKYFTQKFQRENIVDCQYQNFEIDSLQVLPVLLKNPDLAGLNVTIPYKQGVLYLLDEQDAVVRAVGACNCLKVSNGRVQGFNTDVIGFEQSLLPKLLPSHNRALILGTGGSSRAVAYVLKKLGIDYLFVSSKSERQPGTISYASLTEEIVEQHRLIVNCTPLGMSPHTDASPEIPYSFIGSGHYLFDLIYNPAKTVFLQEGAARGARIRNGEDMLVIQAEESWKIWNHL